MMATSYQQLSMNRTSLVPRLMLGVAKPRVRLEQGKVARSVTAHDSKPGILVPRLKRCSMFSHPKPWEDPAWEQVSRSLDSITRWLHVLVYWHELYFLQVLECSGLVHAALCNELACMASVCVNTMLLLYIAMVSTRPTDEVSECLCIKTVLHV